VAAALLDIYGPMIVGFAITFAQPDALKGSLVDTLRLVRPTIFFGVPRVYEKIMERMLEFGNRSHCCIRSISRWAKRVGTAATSAEEAGEAPPWGYSLAKFLVYDRVRDALGLDACRFLVSAAAPMAPETLAYFASLNMPVHEVYGMSETTGPSTACLPGARKTGTCGRPLPGMELGVFPLRDTLLATHGAMQLPPGVEGEVCMRGRHIMVGYKDDETNSAASIDELGWLHSGDLGIIDTDGFLRITGRAKELIKTAGGENVPPLMIENVIKEELKAVSHAVVIGDRRRFLMVLLGLRTTTDPLGTPTDHLDSQALAVARDIGSSASSASEAVTDPAFTKYINEGIRRANSRAISQAQHVQKWRIISHDLSVNTGELTATLKIKRSVVAERFRELIEDTYKETSAA
jgi:long-chain-fatty-acid--CoA ligase ACSBG